MLFRSCGMKGFCAGERIGWKYYKSCTGVLEIAWNGSPVIVEGANGMRKKFYFGFAAISCLLFLQGCAENPREDIVVNKNEGTLEKAITKLPV